MKRLNWFIPYIIGYLLFAFGFDIAMMEGLALNTIGKMLVFCGIYVAFKALDRQYG